jgi:hypothetical protein
MYVFAVVLLVYLIHLLVIMVGWSLFVVPVFGLASLTLSQAIGLSLLTTVFRNSEKIASSIKGK